MRAITALTVGYIVIMTVTMFHGVDARSNINAIVIGDALFSSPILISYFVSRCLKHSQALKVMLLFGVAYSLFSLLVFCATFVGEHDAQYQLLLLLIPAVGLPAVAIAGAVAAFWNWRGRKP